MSDAPKKKMEGRGPDGRWTRDAVGKWQPGCPSPNPGGRMSLPLEFKRRGPAFLEKIAEIAEDSTHKMNFDALKWCAERIYGKAPAEVKDDGEERQKAALVAFVEMMTKKAPENETDEEEP